MRRSLPALIILLLALALAPAAAQAGGWATVGLSSTPEGAAAGTPWVVDLTVLQHGVTPLADVTPRITIRGGATERVFVGRPTGKPGVYRAEVVFPAAGRWEYEVRDGFVDVPVAYPAVQVAGAPPATGGGDGPDLALLVPGLLALAAAPLLLLATSRRRPVTA